MKGKVKWFSREKGYGYIVSDEGIDHYFNVREVEGAELPNSGDAVSFLASQGKKGPRASSVVITARSQDNTRSDDRVTCTHCGKRMVPRLITYQGSPRESVCPFCAGVYKDFRACFIATAVYGDAYAPEVIALRRFRDESLMKTRPGRISVGLYYRFSPPFARCLSRAPRLAACVRPFLDAMAKQNS